MLDADGFWDLIATLRGRPTAAALARLTTVLGERDEQDIVAFADRLAEALHALDTPEHFALAREHGAGDDGFLYARCAVVAAGRKAWQKADFRRFADRDAEPLLAVAQDAFEQKTGRAWEHVSPVSYEAGQNRAAWGWLSVRVEWGEDDGWPLAYEALVEAVRRELCKNQDREPQEVVLHPVGPFPREPASLLRRVMQDLAAVLAAPVPEPRLPDDLPEGHFVHGPPPPLPPELWKRVLRAGGLKHAAIANYLRHNPEAAGADYWRRYLGGAD